MPKPRSPVYHRLTAALLWCGWDAVPEQSWLYATAPPWLITVKRGTAQAAWRELKLMRGSLTFLILFQRTFRGFLQEDEPQLQAQLELLAYAFAR